MMSAGRAAESGARVVLLEKNASLGKKLLITGKGRCNLTQAEFNDKEFVGKLNNKKSKFLFSSLASFGPEEVINFFEARNLKTKVERGGRVFPVVNRSYDVLDVLQKYLQDNKVKIIFGAPAQGFNVSKNKIKSVQLKDREILADKFIVCTGGKSYPVTGSTGDGFKWMEELGHKIISLAPALVPLKIQESWVADLQGLSLKNVGISVWQNNKKIEARFGEMLFTHFGLSGPIILDVSKEVGELLQKDEVIMAIDLKPALSAEQLDKRLQRDFRENSNKNFKNYLPDLLPQKLIPVIISLVAVDGNKKINLVTKIERQRLCELLKNLRVTVAGTTGFGQAIVTSGGVDLKEVDSKTMQSKIVPNLFLAGEILDLDGPTGGYNLQIAWSTGHAAGTYAAKKN